MTPDKPRPGKRAKPAPDTHTHLLTWLRSHRLISINGLQTDLGMSGNTLYDAIKGDKKLPARYYQPLVDILTAYGYTPA